LDKVENDLSHRVQNLIHLVAEMNISHTLVCYPKWAHAQKYGYQKFAFLVEKFGITQKQWNKAIAKCVDRDLVKRAYDDFPEWNRSYMREKYGFGSLR
jgi:hypothetical protein